MTDDDERTAGFKQRKTRKMSQHDAWHATGGTLVSRRPHVHASRTRSVRVDQITISQLAEQATARPSVDYVCALRSSEGLSSHRKQHKNVPLRNGHAFGEPGNGLL